MRGQLSTPLETLEGLFLNPCNLMQKRRDKLLDYDRLQYVMDHTDDSEKIPHLREDLLLAKRTYEALNVQLLEELPQFLQAVTSMLEHLLRVLLQAQHSLTTSMSDVLQLLCTSEQLSLVACASSSTDLQKSHADHLFILCKDLTKLSLVPTSIAMHFSLLATRVGPSCKTSETSKEDVATFAAHQEVLSEGRVSHTSTSATDTSANSTLEEEEEEEQRDVPAEGTSLQVMYNFSAQDSAELSVTAGQRVRLMCAHDRLGCKEWWLVQDMQHSQGYIPATYLSGNL